MKPYYLRRYEKERAKELGITRKEFIAGAKKTKIPRAKPAVDTVNKSATPVKKTLTKTTKRIRNRRYKSPRSAVDVVFGGWGR